MEGLTEQETAIYDRQIRVWGVQTQRRLSKSRVLVVGLTAVTAEVCKNLVLAGIGTLGIMDDRIATFDPVSSTFLVSFEDLKKGDERTVAAVSAEALKDFNPMVQVESVQGNAVEANLVEEYDVILLNRASLNVKRKVDELCRSSTHRVGLFTVDCRGSRGEVFVDLQAHSYSSKVAEDATKVFPSFEDVLSVRWSALPKKTSKLFFAMRVLEEFEQATGRQAKTQELLALRNVMCEKQGVPATFVPDNLLKALAEARDREFPPVCAILGGVLGQELVKALSCKGEPLRSFFYFDDADGKGIIEDVLPA